MAHGFHALESRLLEPRQWAFLDMQFPQLNYHGRNGCRGSMVQQNWSPWTMNGWKKKTSLKHPLCQSFPICQCLPRIAQNSLTIDLRDRSPKSVPFNLNARNASAVNSPDSTIPRIIPRMSPSLSSVPSFFFLTTYAAYVPNLPSFLLLSKV